MLLRTAFLSCVFSKRKSVARRIVGIEDLQDNASDDIACLYLNLLSSKHMYVGSRETDKMATYVIKSYFLSAHELDSTFIDKNRNTRIKKIKTGWDRGYINCDVYANMCSWFNMCGFYARKKQNTLKILLMSYDSSSVKNKSSVYVYYQKPSKTQTMLWNWGNVTFRNFRYSHQKVEAKLASYGAVRVMSQYGLVHITANNIFYNVQPLSGKVALVNATSYNEDFHDFQKAYVQNKKIADFLEQFYTEHVLNI